MSRLSRKEIFGSYRDRFVDFEGTVTRDSVQIVQQYLHRVERSDIVHNMRSPNGWREPSAYSVLDQEDFLGQGSAVVTSTRLADMAVATSSLSGSCGWIPKVVPTGLAISNEFDPLVTKALLKVRDQKVNLALAIGEMHKSIDTIASRALSLYRGYKFARKGQFGRAASALGVGGGRKSAKSWLELQYGWLPMLMDIHGAYEEMRRDTRGSGMRFKVTARGHVPYQHSTTTEDDNFIYYNDRLQSFDCQVIYWYEVQNQYLVTASAVGLINPAEILWEVTPWSFVLDWVLPVGDYLGALTADQGMNYLSGTVTSRSTDVITNRAVAKPPYEVTFSGRTTRIEPSGGGERRSYTKSVQRVVQKTRPTPFLPQFKNPFSTGHALNALALLRSLR
jgi:hypothetical protein